MRGVILKVETRPGWAMGAHKTVVELERTDPAPITPL